MRIREAMSRNHVLAGALVVVVALASWRGRASAGPHSHDPPGGNGGGSFTDPSIENRPSGSFEERLMGELACVCGTCEREPILDCDCKVLVGRRMVSRRSVKAG